MPTTIKGQPPSEEVRAKLAEEGRPVLVAFSCGKDSIACELALRDAGVETVLVHLYGVPGSPPRHTLRFVEEGAAKLSEQLGKPIRMYPHRSLFRLLNGYVFQPPDRWQTTAACDLPNPTHEEVWQAVKDDLGLPLDTWVADGVRAADSIVRRASLSRHGVMKQTSRKVSPIADWLKAEVMGRIDAAGVELPVDYRWFGRSFDGLDRRFLAPIKEHAPDDYEQILRWFPLAEMELVRHGL